MANLNQSKLNNTTLSLLFFYIAGKPVFDAVISPLVRADIYSIFTKKALHNGERYRLVGGTIGSPLECKEVLLEALSLHQGEFYPQ